MIDFDKKTDIEIFDKLKTESDEAPEIVELAGYQVTKAELFAHTKDPAITVWDNKIKFNMACLRKFPGVSHIQLLIHPKQQRLIINRASLMSPILYVGLPAEEKRKSRIAI